MASKKHRKNRKIIPYRRPRNDIGKLIFGVIFLYLLINIFIYMGHEKIQFYEVAEGGIVNDRPYTGLILREEQVYNADNSGYINYYLREGKRASVGSRVYSLDETGRLDSLLKEHGVENQTLSDENLADLKKQLSSFVTSRSDEDFGAIYDARYTLEAAVMEYSSFSALDQLDQIARESGMSLNRWYRLSQVWYPMALIPMKVLSLRKWRRHLLTGLPIRKPFINQEI